MQLSLESLVVDECGRSRTSVGACRLEATEARGKPLPMLRPGLKSYFEGGGDFAEDSKGKCVHTLAFVFLDSQAVAALGCQKVTKMPRRWPNPPPPESVSSRKCGLCV